MIRNGQWKPGSVVAARIRRLQIYRLRSLTMGIYAARMIRVSEVFGNCTYRNLTLLMEVWRREFIFKVQTIHGKISIHGSDRKESLPSNLMSESTTSSGITLHGNIVSKRISTNCFSMASLSGRSQIQTAVIS